MSLQILALRSKLTGGLVGDMFRGPDLAVWMWVGGTHHGAAVFKDLDVADVGTRTQFGFLGGPFLDYAPYGLDGHGGQREVVARIEAENPADAAFGRSPEQPGPIRVSFGRIDVAHQRGKVVLKNERFRVLRSLVSAGTLVSGAKVTAWVVAERSRPGGVFHLALPWPLGPMRGNNHPLSFQGIPAAVRCSQEGVVTHALVSALAGALRATAPSTASQV